jgi:hypothetical protein
MRPEVRKALLQFVAYCSRDAYSPVAIHQLELTLTRLAAASDDPVVWGIEHGADTMEKQAAPA